MTVQPLVFGSPTSPVTAPPVLVTGSLSQAEDAIQVRLLGQLSLAKIANARQESYYEGARVVRDLGIAIPPHLKDLEAVAAWPEIVVDVIDERMDWHGWYVDQDEQLDRDLQAIYTQNHLGLEVGQGTLDSLIYGTSMMSVGTGGEGEPDVLVKAESPSQVTGTWSVRSRRLTDAVRERYDEVGRLVGWTLYLPDVTITTSRDSGRVVVIDRDEHGLGRVPFAVLANRARTGRLFGRSEITRAVRSYTDSGMRTLLGAEVAREFYGAPQRYLLGADESMFVDENGNKKSQWDAIIGKILALPRGDNDELPQAGQFNPASPLPFTELLRMYSQMVSAASGMPASHFGFTTDNPASADAIREANSRLDKRSLRRSRGYDLGLVELAELVMLWSTGEVPAPGSVTSRWGDPSTPTPQAAADRALKLISSGVLPAESDVTLEQLGFDPVTIQRIKADRARSAGRTAITVLADAARIARKGTGAASTIG